LNCAELQQELERVEGRLFWLVESRNKSPGCFGPVEKSSRKIWSRKEGRHRYNMLIGFWFWVVFYCICIGFLGWWAWDLIAYGPGLNLATEVQAGVFVIGFFAIFTKFIFTAPEIRPRNLRYFHYTPAEQRPAMREQLEAERAALLEKLAAL
jgi:hypothetical protein